MIIPFPQKPRLVISCGRVSETRHRSSAGEIVVRYEPPILRYFLDYEDELGSFGVWDGETHADAISAARDWLTNGIDLRDRTENQRGIA